MQKKEPAKHLQNRIYFAGISRVSKLNARLLQAYVLYLLCQCALFA